MSDRQTTHNKPRRMTRRMVAAVVALGLIVPALAAAGRLATQAHCPSIVSGAATETHTGAIMVVGVGVLGVAEDGSHILRVGAVPCLGGSDLGVVPADCNDDHAITVKDFVCLQECLDGPAAAAGGMCAKYDLDNDGSVTNADYGQFQLIFGLGVGN